MDRRSLRDAAGCPRPLGVRGIPCVASPVDVSMNDIPPVLRQPPPVASGPAENQGDATGGIIPYKNPHALAAYYLGVFSLIPLLGFICGAIAVPLGVSGLKKKARNPVIRGTIHAWVGIILGSLSVAVHLLLITIPIVAALKHR